MRLKNIILLTAIAALILGVALAWPRIVFFMRTGHFTPVQKIETLHHPVAVTSWGFDGLHLADGRTVQLPGFRSLPTNSVALTEATKHGVEINTGGRVCGLVQIHHWCGNDPVRKQLARVDLSDMMMFLRVGQTDAPVPEPDSTAKTPGGKFTKWGWNISEYVQFLGWQSMKDSDQ